MSDLSVVLSIVNYQYNVVPSACIVGRAGRVAQGRVYRLVTYRFWIELKEHIEPEMQVCHHCFVLLAEGGAKKYQATVSCGSERFHILYTTR